MATKCPNCGSLDTQAAVQGNQCIACGRTFDFDGNLTAPGADASTREAIESRLAPRQVNVVGNLADLQRLGAQEVSDAKSTAFPAPPGVDAKDLDSGGIGVFSDEGDVKPSKAKSSEKAKS